MEAQPATQSSCPNCHMQVRPTDYFCFNCGKNLKPKPLSTSIGKQLALYTGSIILLPFGVVWGMRYLGEKNTKAKIIGVVNILITIVALAYVTIYTISFMHEVQNQLHHQLEHIGY